MASPARFAESEAVDFVIVGSGAAGGVLARELSMAGFDIVVLEQGPYRKSGDFTHDEMGVLFENELSSGASDPQTFRHTRTDKASVQLNPPAALYARSVGGSSTHFSGNFWRLRPVDFKEHSLLGDIPGTGFADWPISYEEMEPYYTRVDWEIGVSGAPGPFDPPRSRPYPVPPLPRKSSGVLFDNGAKKIGLTTQPAPKAILSAPHNGRAGCIHCGFCMGFGCEVGAKSSTLVTMIPEAEATGRCEIRAESTVARLVTNAAGKVSKVIYFDKDGVEKAQNAKSVILAANGVETPRLLFMSESAAHPDGLANSSGLVGKYLMFNDHSVTHAWFDEPLNEYKSVQCTRIAMDFYETDAKRGFYGGGVLDARPFLNSYPIMFGLSGIDPALPQWGAEYKKLLEHNFTRNMTIIGNTTSLAQLSNNVTLDSDKKDRFGRPLARMTYKDHADDHAMASFLQQQALQIFDAAGANHFWGEPVQDQRIGAHLLGTCRMGDDPDTSVVDRYHRSHDVENLFICDGSSFVTSGRGQPTMTIQALAFRAAEHIARAARSAEI